MSNATTYIIDDDRMACKSLKWLIESACLPVQVFDHGLEFLEQADANMASCVLLDVHIPNINGMELLSKLKQHDIIMPVIIVTGHTNVAMAVRAIKTDSTNNT